MTIRVEKDPPNHLAGLDASHDGGRDDVTADVTFSKWDEPVTVTAPPADQVQAGG